MNFTIISNLKEMDEKGVYLIHDNWDDWFEYEISFRIYLKTARIADLGRVKIAKKNQKERVTNVPGTFTNLTDEYFSIGFS